MHFVYTQQQGKRDHRNSCHQTHLGKRKDKCVPILLTATIGDEETCKIHFAMFIRC